MEIFKADSAEDGELLQTSRERERFLKWAQEEMSSARQELQPLWDKYKVYRRQREAIPEHEQKDYPWQKASNISPPIALHVTQTIYAQLKNTFGVRDPFWTIQGLNDSSDLIAQAKVLTKLYRLMAQSPNDLNKAKKDRDILYEVGSLGTQVVKVPYVVSRWNIVQTDSGVPTDIEVTMHDGPDIEPIPPEDFLYRASTSDIQTATWIAHVVHLKLHELRNREAQGVYTNVDAVVDHFRSQPSDTRVDENRNIGIDELQDAQFDIVEFYFFHDPVGDGIYRDCIVTFEENSGEILREGYNELGRRCFAVGNYVGRAGRLEGIGCGQYCNGPQEEGEMLHNSRNDGIHISLAQMFAVRKGSGIRLKETIFPGKVWMLDNPREDIVSLKAGEVYPSSLQAEGISMTYAQKASGMSDAMAGFADQTLKSRDSIGLQASRMKQGMGIFSSVAEGLVEFYSEIGLLILYQLVKNKSAVMEKERRLRRLSDEDLQILDAALSISMADLPLKLRFSVRTSEMEQTFEAQRQNLLTQTQLYGLFMDRILPLQTQMSNPQLPADVKQSMGRLFVGFCKMMEQTIKFFGEEDTSDYIPEYKKVDMMLDMMKALQEQTIPQQAAGGAVQALASPPPEAMSAVPMDESGSGAGQQGGVGGAQAGAGNAAGAAAAPGM